MGLAFSGDVLYVANWGSGTVGAYGTTTGTMSKPNFITGLKAPTALALLRRIPFLTEFGSNTVGKYNATTGVAINADFITGLHQPFAIAVKSEKRR